MTKDEQIAYLMSRLQKAEDALDRIRNANRTRQSRRRSQTGSPDDRTSLLQLLLERDGATCTYCQSPLATDSATIDHVMPLSRGGSNKPENLVLACRPCNSGKQDRGGISPALFRDRHVTVAGGGDVTVTSGGDYRGGNVLSLEGGTENGPRNQEKVGTPHPNGRVLGKPSRDSHGTPDADFDGLREAYPHFTNRTNWRETRERWDRLSKADRAAMLVAVPNYAACRDVLRGAEAGAQVFIGKRMWEQHQRPEPPLPFENGHAEPAGFAALREYNRRREAGTIEGELA